ncbi:MAG: YlxR family protein [Cyanobacteria bacterium P01_G01_bin.19]
MSNEKKNYRRCISCRLLAPKQSFLRIVRLSSNRNIEIDRGMGRSAYLCPNLDCLTKAQSKNRLSSSLRTKVPQHIYQDLYEHLSRQC